MKAFFLVSLLAISHSLSAQVAESAEKIHPLLIGQTVPDAKLQSPSGESLSLQSVVSKKPSVLVFYRGGWCPFCNEQLAGLGKIEEEIKNLGYQIIAVAPDNIKELTKTLQTESISYQIYSDQNAQFI